MKSLRGSGNKLIRPLLVFFATTSVIGCNPGVSPPPSTASAAPAKAPGQPAVPMSDLLGLLPMDRRPTNEEDRLRMEQAEKWYNQNVVGRRITWRVPTVGRKIDFHTGSRSMHKAVVTCAASSVDLGGRAWPVGVTSATSLTEGSPKAGCAVVVDELDPAMVERLRALTKEGRLEVEGVVESVDWRIPTDEPGGGSGLRVSIKWVFLKSLDP